MSRVNKRLAQQTIMGMGDDPELLWERDYVMASIDLVQSTLKLHGGVKRESLQSVTLTDTLALWEIYLTKVEDVGYPYSGILHSLSFMKCSKTELDQIQLSLLLMRPFSIKLVMQFLKDRESRAYLIRGNKLGQGSGGFVMFSSNNVRDRLDAAAQSYVTIPLWKHEKQDQVEGVFFSTGSCLYLAPFVNLIRSEYGDGTEVI